MDIPESRGQNFAHFQTLASQSAVTLERSILLSESRRQAQQIRAAYQELQATYDQTLYALMSALDARDRETEGHSMRVSQLACLIGEKVGLTAEQLEALKRGALLHDIGKIAIRDDILRKPTSLTPEEYTGATFSVSNLGMLDIDQFTAVINPPEAGILAVGSVVAKPVAADGAVVVRRRLRLTMSCDHRVIDGATGAEFLKTLKQMLENPLAMLL